MKTDSPSRLQMLLILPPILLGVLVLPVVFLTFVSLWLYGFSSEVISRGVGMTALAARDNPPPVECQQGIQHGQRIHPGHLRHLTGRNPGTLETLRVPGLPTSLSEAYERWEYLESVEE